MDILMRRKSGIPTRKNHAPDFKAIVAHEAIREATALSEL